jgi:signal transduction histidine kinase
MFESAKLKLTAWYLLIIMLVSISFSAIIFKMLSSELDRFANVHRVRIEQGLQDQYLQQQKFIAKKFPNPPPNFDPELLEETKGRILMVLGIINGIILIISGGFGYLLARKTLKPIGQMIDEQNRFVSDASHELRTPLTSLKLAMEVFLRGKNSSLDDAKKLISNSMGEVNRLHYLTENLLELSRYQQTRPKLAVKKASINEVVNKAISKISQQIEKKKISVSKTNIQYESKVNEQEIVDLLVILLDNAVKYSKDKSKIEIIAKKSSKNFDLHIIDHGIGIAKEDLPFIFDRFYRADSSRVKGGYGLGLSIAKQVAKKNNVLLLVNSVFGKGTDFTVRFLS